MVRSDDLVPFLVPPDRGGVRRAQGVLRAWNPDNFENLVEFNGLTVPNLQVAAGVEALTFQAGDVVLLEGLAPEDALGSWMITGRVITPGPGAALQTIEFMRTALAREISVEVIAQQIHSDFDPGSAVRTSTTYGDPNSAGNPGPAVHDVEISDTGIALVFLNGESFAQGNGTEPATLQAAGYMSFEVTGATSISPSDDRSARTWITAGTSATVSLQSNPTRILQLSGLNPGLHTFIAKYRAEDHPSLGDADNVNVQRRLLSVIAF